ncbi:MAG: peptidoglycan DD-metalloendopeptidase family protein [Eubacteriales bacterium]|nr:peptidoglycan DD-metalloendopeptidase family protein [Eubacteriales bacterium]
MRKRWIAAGIGVWALGAIVIGSGCLSDGNSVFTAFPDVVKAATQSEQTQQKINEANQEVQNLQQEKKDLQADLEEIEDKKSNLTDYIETLDDKMTNLTKKMEKNQEKIDTTQGEIEVLSLQEAEVTEKMNSQYETMKTRIKCIYENGDNGYMELLMGSASLSELYNRIEYVSKVSNYDKKMLSDYEETQNELAQTKLMKQDKKDKLEATKETLSFEKKSVNKLLEKKKDQLEQFNSLIDQSESELDAYNEQIEKKSNEVEKLLAQQRQQIAAEEAAAKNSSGGSDDTGAGDSGSSDTGSSGSTKASASGFVWPLASAGRISCGFGPRKSPTAGASTYHKGIDIAIPTGTVVRASKAGKVVTATYSSSAGNYVALYHGGGVYTYYMHCSSLSVSVGDQVAQGQTIALSGSTGISTGPHLHFAVNVGGQYVNPLNYVSR